MKFLLALLPALMFSPITESEFGNTLVVDVQASTVYWKGTKMRRLRKHEGTIKLSEGSFELAEGKVTGGEFVIDMGSIKVTDIPAHETVPIKNLTDHLKSEDFFAVERFPKATFKLTKVLLQEGTTHTIEGNLTIRGITHSIEFEAKIDYEASGKVKVTGGIELDRQKWNVAFKGVKDMVVDDTMYLRLDIVSI